MRYFAAMAFLLMVSSLGMAEERKPFVYDEQGRRDPFWPLVSPDGTIQKYETDFLITDLNLEGIMAGTGGENFAIINGLILRANDSIGQFVVDHIESNLIILKKGKQKFELKLKKEE